MQILQWQKSTYSGDSSNCVEIAATSNATHVRDSKRAQGPRLAFHPSAWAPFLSHTASGGHAGQDS